MRAYYRQRSIRSIQRGVSNLQTAGVDTYGRQKSLSECRNRFWDSSAYFRSLKHIKRRLILT